MNFGSSVIRPPSRRGISPARQDAPPAQRTTMTVYLILLVFVLTIFEGAIRKWVVVGSPILRYLTYFSKDFVFILAAIPALGRLNKYGRLALGTLLPISVALLLLPTVLNLTNSNVTGLILSVRAYLVIPICGFLAAGLIRSVRDADRIAYVVGFCVFLVAALGVKQYYLPATHWLNKYETAEEAVHIVAEFAHVRATGTFAFITGMGILSGVAGWAGVYLFLSGANPIRRLFAVAVMGAGLVCAMVSMSRAGAYLSALTIVGAVVLFRRVREVIFLGAIAVIAYSLLATGEDTSESSVTSELQKGLTGRIEKRDSVTDRLTYAWMNLQYGVTLHPMGEGLGIGQVGGQFATTGKSTWGGGYETELARITFEVGVLGFFGVIIWRIAAVWGLWRHLNSTADPKTRALLAASLPLFGALAGNFMAFNHTASSFAWAIFALSLGIAMAPAQISNPKSQIPNPKNRIRI